MKKQAETDLLNLATHVQQSLVKANADYKYLSYLPQRSMGIGELI